MNTSTHGWSAGMASASLGLMTAACSGAPSLPVAGAYFPAWLACGLIAVGAALLVRVLMIATGLQAWFPLQFLLCATLGCGVGMAAWLAWTGV